MYSRPCALIYFRCFPIVIAYIVSIVAKREVGVPLYPVFRIIATLFKAAGFLSKSSLVKIICENALSLLRGCCVFSNSSESSQEDTNYINIFSMPSVVGFNSNMTRTRTW